jgi:ketosteroid isomerase-like protein
MAPPMIATNIRYGRREHDVAEHPNVELMRRAERAFSEGDRNALMEILSEEIVVHVPGRSVLSGDHRGRDAVLAFNERIFDLSGGTYENEVHEILATDDHIVVLQRNRARRGTKSLDVNEALVLHPEDGQIVEVWELYMDQLAFDAFWA